MYRKTKIKINLFYNNDGEDIVDVLNQDFKEFFEEYLKVNVL